MTEITPAIEEKITIHDNYQFEIKESYNFATQKKKQSYYAKIYIFTPNNLHINSETYTRDDFYRDLRSNIRLRTPVVSLEEFSLDGKPVKRLEKSVRSGTTMTDATILGTTRKRVGSKPMV